MDSRTPVVVGVGQVLAHHDPTAPVAERLEPVALMARALEQAADDCGPGGPGRRLLERAQSLRVLRPLSWSYDDPARLVAGLLGIDPPEHAQSAIGGDGPQAVAAASAAEIAAGRLDVVLLAGADCIASRVAAYRAGVTPAWTIETIEPPETIETTEPSHDRAASELGSDREPVTSVEHERGLDRPRNVFPLFENALRATTGESIEEHRARVARLWSRFSKVAADNPFAWSRRFYTPEEIAGVGDENRMIAFPYPKLMNANDRVDMGAALVLCSLEAARRAGVPSERMVFPLSAAVANDHWFLTQRDELHRSPAIAACATAAFAAAGMGLDDVDLVDLYSCFPCAVQMAANAIGLDLEDTSRTPTVTGGLTFAGGPGNNYVTHSLATMTGHLRRQPGAVGLVTGLGWYATKHALGLWSSAPPTRPFRHVSAQDEVDRLPRRRASRAGDTAVAGSDGVLRVETYTVVHGRRGEPRLGIFSLLDEDGARAWGNADDVDVLEELEAHEGCGRRAKLLADGRVELTGD